MITIIFDIDGTLIESTRFDNACFIAAVRELMGADAYIRDDWSGYRHVTDSGILAEIAEENNFALDARKYAAVRASFFGRIKDHLDSNPCIPRPGAVELINQLRHDDSIRLGFATGGWRRSALMKLKQAGFDFDPATLFSSDDHHERVEIMLACRDHIDGSGGPIVYVGDAPWDQKATASLGWPLIATGPRLRDQAEIWIENFTSANWQNALSQALRL